MSLASPPPPSWWPRTLPLDEEPIPHHQLVKEMEEKVRRYQDWVNRGQQNVSEFVTKDTGVREKFESGMVRDTQEGKPRFDLVFDGPMAELVLYEAATTHKRAVVNTFFDWYRNGSQALARDVLSVIAVAEGGLRVFLPRVGDLLARGAVKYSERNWMKAAGDAEYNRFRSSAARHFAQYIIGDTDEDHAAAVWFNVNGAEYVYEKMEKSDGRAAA